MVRYAMTFTRDKDQACNVAQDVFIKLWQIRESDRSGEIAQGISLPDGTEQVTQPAS